VRLLAAHGSSLKATAERSLTLLRVFLAASALVLALGGVVLSSVLTKALTDQSLADNTQSLTRYVDGVLRPTLAQGSRLQVGPQVSSVLLGELRRQPDLVTVKVWRPDGVLAWTNRGRDRIGKRFEVDGDLAEALRDRRAAGSIDDLSADEDQMERSLGFDHMLEVYAPVLGADAKTALGAYEIYADPAGLERSLA